MNTNENSQTANIVTAGPGSRIAGHVTPHGVTVLTPGHLYALPYFEPESILQTVQFIHKQPRPMGELGETIANGTTNEAVLDMLIDRMGSLQSKFPCRENAIVITHLEEALMWLEKRTRDRKARGVEGKHQA